MNNGVPYKAFGGRVVFYIAPYITPRIMIQSDKIRDGVPGHEKFTDLESAYFETFAGFMPFTLDIEFNLNDPAPPALLDLKRFWDAAKQPARDWLALWELFQDTYDIQAVGSEWRNAINSVVPEDLAADPALATPLPEGEELEQLADDDPKLLAGNGSKRNSNGLPKRKEKRNLNAVQ
jgi:hypothetical protein